MKRIYLLGFMCGLIVVSISGQSTQCGSLKILSPEYLDPWDSRYFTAKTATGKSVTADWILVTENYRTKRVEVETIGQKDSVRPQLWDSNDSGIVTAIATAKSPSGCSMTAAVHTVVVERTGSPLIIDEYGKMARNDERGRLDVAITEMNTRPKLNLLVYLYFRPTDQPIARRLRMTQIRNHVVSFRKFDAKRVVFLLSESDRTYVRLQAASPIETEAVSSFPEYLVIRASQFADYKKLFQ
ncbi:MAG: hypothetical protein AB7F88_11355 [Pyrinomonadaceae bacterium]